MTSPAILIVAPTKRELGGLRETDARIQIALCGIGREAGERVAALLDAAPCSLLVSLGFAGALDPALRPGDLIVADAFLYADAADAVIPVRSTLSRRFTASSPLIGRGGSDAYPPPDPLSLQGERYGERALATGEERSVDGAQPRLHDESSGRVIPAKAGTYPSGPILTVDAPLLTPAAKRRARAASGAAVVDMEGRRIAEAAAERGVPIVAVRAVIDEADFALPPFAAEIAAARGHDERARAFRAAANPREAAGMLLLALRARKAARSLRRAADAILAAQPERP